MTAAVMGTGTMPNEFMYKAYNQTDCEGKDWRYNHESEKANLFMLQERLCKTDLLTTRSKEYIPMS